MRGVVPRLRGQGCGVLDCLLELCFVDTPVGVFLTVDKDHRNEFPVELLPQRVIVETDLLKFEESLPSNHIFDYRAGLVTEVALVTSD